MTTETIHIDPNAIRANHDQSFTTEAGEFLVTQRNVGFFHNDGKWVVNLCPDLYWDGWGYLTKRREGRRVGAFATIEEAEEAIRATERPAELEEHVILSGR